MVPSLTGGRLSQRRETKLREVARTSAYGGIDETKCDQLRQGVSREKETKTRTHATGDRASKVALNEDQIAPWSPASTGRTPEIENVRAT